MRFTAVCAWTKGRFTIGDGAGTPQFEVVRTDTVAGNIVSLRSLAGGKLAEITPRYSPARLEITAAAAPPITVRHRGWFGRHYDISAAYGEMTATVSDFTGEDYHIIGAGTRRATVSRGLTSQRNLTIDMADGDDAVSLLSIVLAVETIRRDRHDTQSAIPFVRLVLSLVN